MKYILSVLTLAILSCSLQSLPASNVYEIRAASPTQTAKTPDKACKEHVKAEHLNLRKCASTQCEGKAVLNTDQSLTIRKSSGYWYFVDGQKDGAYFYGWVHSAYVEDCLVHP